MESNKMAHVEEWLRAAQREDTLGNPATAITFRNMAWLVENADNWTGGAVLSASEQVKRYIEAKNNVA
jgi:hypothetical protein